MIHTTEQEQYFWAAIADNPHDDLPRLIYADYLEDCGKHDQADLVRVPLPPPDDFYGSGYEYGYEYGYGSGYEYGAGAGSGSGDGAGYGYGSGSGYGAGDGYEYGYGAGDGYGYGYGDGSGDNFNTETELINLLGDRTMPIVGLRQLILCGRAFAFVGDVTEQIGPYQFRVENASMLCRTGGVPWDRLADGHSRNQATFRYWGTITVGPYFSVSREWLGELPPNTN